MAPRIRARVTPPAVLARDAALSRVSRTRRLVIGASAALSAAFAGLVSASAPGKASPRLASVGARAAINPGKRPTPSQNALRAPALPPLASASQLGLQGPSDSPQPDAGGDGSAGSPDSGGGSASSGAPSGDQAQSQAPAQQPAPSPDQSAAAQPSTSSGGGVVSGGS